MQGNLAALAPDQLSVVLQYLPDPLLVVDADRNILTLNTAAETLTGLQASEVVGRRTCRETIACHDRQGRRLCDTCPHLAAAASRMALSQAGLTIHDAEGRAIPVTATYFPLPGDGTARADGLILVPLSARAAASEPAHAGGLQPRERFLALYAREQERAQRYGSGLAVLRVAVRPRLAGETSTPAAAGGDAELETAFTAVATLLLRSVRAVDVVGQCDPFDCAILLPAATFASARAVVARLEHRLRELEAGSLPKSVELHLGVTLAEGYDDLLARSGQRLAPLPRDA